MATCGRPLSWLTQDIAWSTLRLGEVAVRNAKPLLTKVSVGLEKLQLILLGKKVEGAFNYKCMISL